MKAKTIDESTKPINDKWAVAFIIKKNGVDVDFKNSNYIIDSIHNFFNDIEFMNNINNILQKLILLNDTFEKFNNTITSENDLLDFFKEIAISKIYKTGIMDAMEKDMYYYLIND